MLLPQNATNSKTDSSLSISMQPFVPEALRHHPVWSLALRAVAGGLTIAAALWLASTTVRALPIGEEALVAGGKAELWAGLSDWVAASYQRAPALVLGLAALVAVPPLALFGLWVARRDAASVSVSEARTQIRRVRRDSAPEPREGVRTGHIPLRPLEAWVEVLNRSEVAPGTADKRYGLAHTLLRIGRETDNDICLHDKTVHRYHAAIHRTEDAEFVITDLSSVDGNGVVVNGRAVAEARLKSGDVIELGNARLKFSAGPAGTA